jgi:glycine/D-amino acid oxidase-like deaminating enzyme
MTLEKIQATSPANADASAVLIEEVQGNKGFVNYVAHDAAVLGIGGGIVGAGAGAFLARRFPLAEPLTIQAGALLGAKGGTAAGTVFGSMRGLYHWNDQPTYSARIVNLSDLSNLKGVDRLRLLTGADRESL